MYRMRETRFDAVHFTGVDDNAAEVISWLGEDFVAFTNGSPVIVGETRYEHPAFGQDPSADTRVLIFTNTTSGQLASVSVGAWIIRDAQFGYLIMDDMSFKERFIPDGTTESAN